MIFVGNLVELMIISPGTKNINGKPTVAFSQIERSIFSPDEKTQFDAHIKVIVIGVFREALSPLSRGDLMDRFGKC